MKQVSGDIVAYINSDDTYAEGVFELVSQEFQKTTDVQWVYGKCKIIDKQDREIRKWISLYKNILGSKYSYNKLLAENFISQMTVFWRKSVMDEIGLFEEEEHLCMDYEYWLRIGQKYDAQYIPQHLANFRWYPTSKSGDNYSKQFSSELDWARKYADKKQVKFPIALHRFNVWKIVTIYKLLDLFRF